MATDNHPVFPHYVDDDYDDDIDDADDAESLASVETDDGEDHLPEKIVAETTESAFTWYLVKWQDCPLVRSSWEGCEFAQKHPRILEEWCIEKQKQVEGKSKPFDLVAFQRAVRDVEASERQRRILRRLKRRVNRVLAIVTA